MIIGSLDNTSAIEKLHPGFREAFRWLRENYTTIHASGARRVDIVPGDVYANIDTAVMRRAEEQTIEIHKKYIDIHVPVSQSETIGWQSKMELGNPCQAYDEDKDYAMYNQKVSTYVTIEPGKFCIMTPDDGHAPIIGEGVIEKICVKIHV